MTNPGFESGNSGWQLSGGCAINNNSANAEEGNWYLSCSGTNDVEINGVSNGTQWIPTTPGQVYYYGGWIERVSGTGNLSYGCEVVNSSQSHVAWCTSVGTFDSSSGTSWTFYQGSITIPTNGAYVRFFAELHCCGDSDLTATTGYFDGTFFDGGSIWSQTFGYDAFGNISKSGSVSFAALYSSSTNRITSVGSFNPTYDANGNILTDPAHAYSWDSAGRPVTIDSVNMTYDALGRMVEQNRSGAYTQFVYGPHGGKLAIMSGQTLQKAFIPLVGGAQAVYNASGLLYYGHSGHLGSMRLGSTSSRGVSFDLAYAPFGETYSSFGSTDPAFTGQRQDTVNGVYDFPAREYSNEGRWASPDPAGLAAADASNPQSWNRYAYVGNNPLSITDPTGLHYYDCVWDGGCNAPSSGGGGGGGGGYYGGGPGGCSLDGIQTACGNLTGLGSNGIAPCPAIGCSGYVNGVFIQYTADANGIGFYSCLTTGQFATQQQAGIAAVMCANGQSIYYNREFSGNVYQKDSNGKYSFTFALEGSATEGLFDPSDIPDGTEYAGFYHTHGAFDIGYDSEQFSQINCQPGQLCDTGIGMMLNQGQPMYLGTPAGRVEVYFPGQSTTLPVGCVLIGSPVPAAPGTGTSSVDVPSCP